MKISKKIRSALAKESAEKSVKARKKKLGKNYNKVMKEMSEKAMEVRRNKVKLIPTLS